MIVVKSDIFATHSRLTLFINENNIKREDILSITSNASGFAIFFYGDSEITEVTHGLFS